MLRIAVLHNVDYEQYQPGAPSYEADAGVRDTAMSVVAALDRLGYAADVLTIANDLEPIVRYVADVRPAAVFNLVESIGGDASREPEVPELLEKLNVAYTGNSAPVLRLSGAKDEAQTVLARAGVAIPRGTIVERGARAPDLAAIGVHFPVFVKPARTDASIGIDQESVVRNDAQLTARLQHLSAKYPGPYLVEEYLPGREVNVAIIPEPVAGHLICTDIDFSGFTAEQSPIVTYDCKWRPGSSDYNARSVPSAGRLPDAEIRAAQSLARRAFIAIGGTAYGRVDLRVGRDGKLYVIDVNPNPDIHPEAGISIAAQSIGLGHDAMIDAFLKVALQGKKSWS